MALPYNPAMPEPSLDRYHRQILLADIGEAGQRRLLASSALILGCGALGTHIADTLARAGVGRLVIVDRDTVEATNLQRQVLFDESDVAHGVPKAEAARQKIAAINSDVTVEAHVTDANPANIESLAGLPDQPVDVIVDGLDNFETRYLANDVAVKHGIAYCYGGAVGTTGAAFTILPHTQPPETKGDTPWEQADLATPCLRCVFDQAPPPGLTPTCDTVGVLGPSVAWTAHAQAAEAIKILLGRFDMVRRTMLHMDLWHGEVRQLRLDAAYEQNDCVCCKQRHFEHLAGEHGSGVTRLCGRNAVQITPNAAADASAPKTKPIELQAIATRLAPHGEVQVTHFLLRAQLTDAGKPYELTLFRDGRAIIKGTEDATAARAIYARYVGA